MLQQRRYFKFWRNAASVPPIARFEVTQWISLCSILLRMLLYWKYLLEHLSIIYFNPFLGFLDCRHNACINSFQKFALLCIFLITVRKSKFRISNFCFIWVIFFLCFISGSFYQFSQPSIVYCILRNCLELLFVIFFDWNSFECNSIGVPSPFDCKLDVQFQPAHSRVFHVWWEIWPVHRHIDSGLPFEISC